MTALNDFPPVKYMSKDDIILQIETNLCKIKDTPFPRNGIRITIFGEVDSGVMTDIVNEYRRLGFESSYHTSEIDDDSVYTTASVMLVRGLKYETHFFLNHR